jgi:V/A-type H+-transporting ATPase subunit I
MFFPERMRKVDMFILANFKDAVKKELFRFGEFETINVTDTELKKYFFKKVPVEERLLKYKEIEKRVDYLLSLVRSFWERIEEEKEKETSYDIFSEEEIEPVLVSIESNLSELNTRLEEIKRKKVEYELNLKKKLFLSSMKIDLSEYEEFQFLGIYFGSIPAINKTGLNNALKDYSCELRFLGEIDKETVIFLVYPKKIKEKIDSILKNAYFKDYGLPSDASLGGEGLVLMGLSLVELQDEEIWIEKKIKELLRKVLPVLEKLKRSITYYQSLNLIEKEIVSTKDVVLISGWVPDKKFEKLKSTIENITDKKCAITSLADYEVMEKEGIVPPTKLSNPSFLKSFEGLVLNFGVPKYGEIDPTVIVAFSYVIMYGVMFGDVGHGLVLFLIGLLGLFVKKFSFIRSISNIICYVGLSSAFFGLLYGSVFGFEDVMKAIWIRPISHIMEILLFAVGFGVWMVSLGIVLNIINSIKEKNYGRLFFSSTGIPGLGFYWSFLYILVQVVLKKKIGNLIYIPLVFLLIIAFEKPLEKLIFRHKGHLSEEEEETSINPIMILIEVVEAVLTFLTNTISFMRVGAFALNHGALMSAIFIISKMFKSPITQWVVILFGNLFVIVFEGFIVSIQVMRLEYYEFFMKFFRGGGKSFEGIGKIG